MPKKGRKFPYINLNLLSFPRKKIKFESQDLLIKMNDFNQISHLFGNEIRKRRIEAGYKSYEQFAEDHDISRIQYWKMENGNNFTLKSLLKVLDGLNIDFNDFIKSPSLLNHVESESAKRLRQIIDHFKLSKKNFLLQ